MDGYMDGWSYSYLTYFILLQRGIRSKQHTPSSFGFSMCSDHSLFVPSNVRTFQARSRTETVSDS